MKVDLKIYRPNGEEYSTYSFSEMMGHSAEKKEIVIGREDEDSQFDRETDIKLPPEEKLISRRHFKIEIKNGGYFWMKDLGSTNPAFLKKAMNDLEENLYLVSHESEYRLQHEDRILLRSKFPVEGNSDWVFCFYDLNQTDYSDDTYPSRLKYKYDLQSKILNIRTGNSTPEKIQYVAQELTIVHYIAQKVKESGNESVLVTYDELISAVWPGEEQWERSAEALRPRVSRINKEITNRCGNEAPRLIDSVRGHGYRLNNCVVLPRIST
ncbi:MAG: FHA domain-containing protein [Cyanobacteriota bacterium]|nr:FHA domain-containing protein [Cyanobacteriota bacterium]